MSRKKIKVCIHCSATPQGSRLTFEQCKSMHIKGRGWFDIGYNFYVEIDGTIHLGRSMGKQLAHAKGHNNGFIAICYEGGLDANKQPADTRTEQQKQALTVLKLYIERVYEVEEWTGHRDLSPDKNHDGAITPDEWLKACPCFDVKAEYV